MNEELIIELAEHLRKNIVPLLQRSIRASFVAHQTAQPFSSKQSWGLCAWLFATKAIRDNQAQWRDLGITVQSHNGSPIMEWRAPDGSLVQIYFHHIRQMFMEGEMAAFYKNSKGARKVARSQNLELFKDAVASSDDKEGILFLTWEDDFWDVGDEGGNYGMETLFLSVPFQAAEKEVRWSKVCWVWAAYEDDLGVNNPHDRLQLRNAMLPTFVDVTEMELTQDARPKILVDEDAENPLHALKKKGAVEDATKPKQGPKKDQGGRDSDQDGK